MSSPRNVRFAGLLGLVTLPIGAGFVTDQPEFGLSIASLLLTVYQLSFTSEGTED